MLRLVHLHLGIENSQHCKSSLEYSLKLTSQDFSWLQKGQVNCVSIGSIFFFLASGFLLDFRRPILAPAVSETKSHLFTIHLC